MKELAELIEKYSPIYDFLQKKYDVGRLLSAAQELHKINHGYKNTERHFITTHVHAYYGTSLGWDERCDIGEHLMSLCDGPYGRRLIATYMRHWFSDKDPDQFPIYTGKNAAKQGVKQSPPEVRPNLYKAFGFDIEMSKQKQWRDTKYTPVEAFIQAHAHAYLTAGYQDQALRYEGVKFMLKHRETPLIKDTLIAYLKHWHGVDDPDLFDQCVGHKAGVVEI